MFTSLGLPELIIIFLIVLLFFGGNRLPKVPKAIGESIRNFKSSIRQRQF
ncbi:twin-arginine translocase TatA/TatE family subunit [bacterium]|nr:twin-arginine translocase TatA/TatE family subunit [bacterium]MCI0601570.1 twin-arginine translocase TatA/TatE family subunit [bacterium]